MSIDDNIAIDIQNVTKMFGEFTALKDVSLDIRDNEFFTLLGPSGCGKTTLLRLIAGFEAVSQGAIMLYGQNIADLMPNKRPINTVFQNYALFPHMNVTDNVMFGLLRLGQEKTNAKRRVSEVLELVRLSDFADRMPNQLSGGQQQRVALARALAPSPRVLLLDEPLSALDLKLRQAGRLELQQIQIQTGITFIFVTHDQEEALTMSDRIAVIDGGRVQQVGSAREIYEAPENKFVADFIGESTMLPLKTEENNQLYFNHILVDSAPDQESSQDWMLVVRPERLFPLSQDFIDSDQHLIFKGKVIESVYQGETAFAQVSISEDHQLTVRFGTDASARKFLLEPGDSMELGLNRKDIILIPR